MYYDIDTLLKVGSIAHINVPLSAMTDRTKNAVKRAIKSGMLQSTTGQAATYMAIIADYAKLPIMAFSKKGQYWNSLHLRHMPMEASQGLSEWWQTDRVLYRLEKPEEWGNAVRQYEEYKHHTWYGDVVVEPDWAVRLKKANTSVRIVGTKDLNVFEPVAQLYIHTDDYKTKAETLIQLIDEGATINVAYENLN